MKTSNSKLTADQKLDRKDMLARMPDVQLFSFPESGVTVAASKEGTTVQFAVSLMSEDEQKFRRKVGEYHALSRIWNGQTVMCLDMRDQSQRTLEDKARDLAVWMTSY